MVRFQCDGNGKKNVIFFGFCVEMFNFSQNFWRVLPKWEQLITCRL